MNKSQRSILMATIRSKNTKPEKWLRSDLHRKGFRFRIHNRGLPGTPDIVLPKYNTVILVNGCFWHQHGSCSKGKMPRIRLSYWRPKLLRNVERDLVNTKLLKKLGWKVIVVWECEIKRNPQKILSKIYRRLT